MKKSKKAARKIKSKKRRPYTVRGETGVFSFLEAIETKKVPPNSIVFVEDLNLKDFKSKRQTEICGVFLKILNAGVEIVVPADNMRYRPANVEDLLRGETFSVSQIATLRERLEATFKTALKKKKQLQKRVSGDIPL